MRARSLFLLGIVAVMLAPTAAHASCVMPPPMRRAIADAPAVFVGTVTGARFNDRWATVSVVEIWQGENIPPSVEVRSGVGSSNTVTSVDRFYDIGETYLFIPYARKGNVFRDNACTNTTSFTDRVAEFRPATFSTPSPTGAPTPAPTPSIPAPSLEPSGQERVWIWMVPALLVGALALGYLGLRLVRRS